MKYLKSVEEFNESFLGNLFGRKKEVETEVDTKEVSEPKDKYRELVDGIKSSFDEPRAIDHYMRELEKIGKWKEFINSEEGEQFKKMVSASRR
jgi:hypothetical protein